MNTWIVFSVVSLIFALLFFVLMWHQNKHTAKRWLITKIKQDSQQKEAYITALNRLDGKAFGSLKTTFILFLFIIPTALFLNNFLFPATTQQQQPPSIEEALAHLQQALQENPNDLEGQMLYASAMMRMQNFKAAVKAYNKANELAPDNADILTELAEAVAFNNNTGTFIGEPEQLINQALTVNPNHQKALWLKGIIAYEKKEYPQAEQLWTSLALNITDEQVKATIIKQINQARAQQNKPALMPENLNASRNKSPMPVTKSIAYRITIEADEAIKNQDFAATTRVFVSAKAPSGPPMPVAAINVAPPFEWPLTVTLSDQHNLTPNQQLSDFEQVILSASLSINGDASVRNYESDKLTVSIGEPQATLKLSIP
ncbi:MAG: tetratricopeptide repeat protein [Proteobacteria bacterium]|nr:MAG: tetratricopeptide repeat protein [Pseudomonadota bacterium]